LIVGANQVIERCVVARVQIRYLTVDADQVFQRGISARIYTCYLGIVASQTSDIFACDGYDTGRYVWIIMATSHC